MANRSTYSKKSMQLFARKVTEKDQVPARRRRVSSFGLHWYGIVQAVVGMCPSDKSPTASLQTYIVVPAGSPSRDGDVTVYVQNINQPSLPTPFYSVLASSSVFMALSSVFHSINYSDNSPLSHSVLLVLFCPIGPFIYVSLYESLPQPWYYPLWLTGLKAPTN